MVGLGHLGGKVGFVVGDVAEIIETEGGEVILHIVDAILWVADVVFSGMLR